MYTNIFKLEVQDEMRDFFMLLSKKGTIKKHRKKEQIDHNRDTEFGIVTKGKVGVAINSSNGIHKDLFFLTPGEVFGETYFLENSDDDKVVYCVEDSEVSYIKYSLFDEELKQNPRIYKYLYHSLFRKYQIVKSQLTNLVFQDSTSNVADTLVRIAMQRYSENREYVVEFTHQRLADLIGCSRITVTKVLNELKSQELIELESKRIIIKDMPGLNSFIEKRK